MTINQYKARGEFVDVLLQVVALDDVVCLMVFSLASALVSARAGTKKAAPMIRDAHSTKTAVSRIVFLIFPSPYLSKN